MSNQIDPIKNDLERAARSAANRTSVGKGMTELQREGRNAKGILGRLMGIFGKK